MYPYFFKSPGTKGYLQARFFLAVILLCLNFRYAGAQQEIELYSGSYAGTIPNGPTLASQTASFRHNTGGTVFAAMSNPVSVTASFANQQFTTVPGAAAGMVFGGTLTGATNQNVVPNAVFVRMDAKGGATSATFTSNPDGASGTGFDVAENYGFEIFNVVNMWFGTSGPAGKRAYYGDLVFTFSRPVSDPVIHFADLGANNGSNNSTAEFELPAGSPLTFTKLSGSTPLSVPATNDKILNSSATPAAGCGTGAACGSIRINGKNIQSVTLQVYMRFRNTSFSSVGSNVTGEAFLVSFSFPTFNLSGNVYNDANGLTDNSVNGAVTSAGNSLYAFAADSFNNIQGSSAVSAGGSFSFTNLVKGSYTVRLSTSSTGLGAVAPGAASLPSGWNSTGEFRGTGNGNDGTVDGSLNDAIVLGDVPNYNLGIERIPTANSIFYQLQNQPALNSVLALNGAIGSSPVGSTPIRPNGNDIEDGVLSQGKTLIINTLPANGTLLYNGLAVTAGQVITAFSPDLLAVRFNGTGYKTLSFTYSYYDAALAVSVPATYTLTWDIPLPVTLLSFSVQQQSPATAAVKWETATEQNLYGFTIEYSTDAQQWERAGFVTATGTDGSRTAYSFIHPNTKSGTHYYRLRMEDRDGGYRYSYIRSFSRLAAAQVTIYPNPAGNFVYINIPDGNTPITGLSLYDLSGRKLRDMGRAVNGTGIDLSEFSAGIYLLKVQFAGEEPVIKKLVKK